MSATPSCCHAVANFQADIRRVERKTLPLVTELWPAVLVFAVLNITERLFNFVHLVVVV